jgi:diguanylate cyclase (GGDEF)-like protein
MGLRLIFWNSLKIDPNSRIKERVMMKTSLKNRILVPLTIGLFSLLVVFLASLFWIERSNIEQRVERQFKSTEHFFYFQQEIDARLFSGMLETIMNDRAIQTALKAGDRKALLSHTASLFKRISFHHPVTHLYFSDAQRINLLRVHQPDRYGDRIDRFTTLEAEKTGKIAYGLELGPMGTLTLRVVAPMIVNGKRIGFVELGEEIEHIIAKLKKTIGVELIVHLHKKFLHRPGWEAGMKMLGQAYDWDRFPDVVLLEQTLPVNPETLTKFFSEGSHTLWAIDEEIFSQKHRYRYRYLAIKDVQGVEVGDMVIMIDVTDQVTNLYYTMGVITIFSVFLGGVLFFLFRFFLGRVQNQLTTVQQKIIDLEKDRTRMESAEKIRLLAYYDSLTGLPNRTFHKELMKRAIEHARRNKEIFALFYIGVDNFQRINDSLGYSIGDILLKAIADRLTNSLRKSDYVARSDEEETINVVSRVGGDEFIVLAQDISQAQDAAKMSRRLLEEMSAPYDLSGREVFLTVSIGISLYPDDGTDVDDLLKNAEKAMRHTKSEGKNSYHFYSSSMQSSILEVLTMESDLHKALERNELVLYYQPKVDATTRMVKGMEALIRWIHPDKGLIPPMQFIPLAETSGLIIPIGEFVIRTVCRQIKTWQEAGYKQINISLNVSGRQFDQQNLIEIIKDALQDTMISPQCLEVEVTESTIMRNPEKAIRILTELKTMGIQISIDDFGTGYSSLSYLKRLPLDFLKIDQSFVKSLVSDSRDQAIVRATIAMAHSLNLKTIAEGVETQEQLSFLQEHGCDEIQGYLFSRPLPAEDIPVILAKGYL